MGAYEPLDATLVHPEHYSSARLILTRLRLSLPRSPSTDQPNHPNHILTKGLTTFLASSEALNNFSSRHKIPIPQLRMIVQQLVPGQDPRQHLPPPRLRAAPLAVSDLTPGLKVWATVKNNVPFGVFCDIGIGKDALLHRSKLTPSNPTVSPSRDLVSLDMLLPGVHLLVEIDRVEGPGQRTTQSDRKSRVSSSSSSSNLSRNRHQKAHLGSMKISLRLPASASEP